MKRRGASHNPRDAWQSREELAQLAARLLVRGEAHGFRGAKQKAAEALGLRENDVTLEPLALLRAVIEYQRLFDREELPRRNARLRAAALDAMKFLRDFSPRLHGPVLFGTTLADTPVGLHLFNDEVEHVTRFLLQHKIPFDLRTPPARRGREAGWPVFDCHRGGVDFELTVLPMQRLRQAPPSRLTGGPCISMDESTLARRLTESPGEPWLEELPGFVPGPTP